MYAAQRQVAAARGEPRPQGERMPMTPIDIENQKFEVKMRGYDRDQVKRFLAALAEETTGLISDRSRLEEEVLGLRKKVQEQEARDKRLQDTILALRDMTEKMKDEKRKEKANISRARGRQGEEIIQDARIESQKIETHITQLRIDRDNFEDRLRLLLEEHHRLLAQRRNDAAGHASLAGIGKRPGAE